MSIDVAESLPTDKIHSPDDSLFCTFKYRIVEILFL